MFRLDDGGAEEGAGEVGIEISLYCGFVCQDTRRHSAGVGGVAAPEVQIASGVALVETTANGFTSASSASEKFCMPMRCA